MPYVSDRQRRFMHAVHPKIAARWDRKYGGSLKDKVKAIARKRKKKGA